MAITAEEAAKHRCPICDTPGYACGQSHVTTLITSETIKGERRG